MNSEAIGPSEAPAGRPAPGRKRTKKKVLIVDDSPSTRKSLTEALEACEEFRFRVTSAADMDAAVKASGGVDFDVLILNLRLAQGAGSGPQEPVHVLRRRSPDAFRIALTDDETPEARDMAARLDARSCIEKDAGYVERVTQSAVEGVRAIDERRQLEAYVLKKWLPKHKHELRAKYPGKYIGVLDDKVVVDADTLGEMAVKIAQRGDAPMPYVLRM